MRTRFLTRTAQPSPHCIRHRLDQRCCVSPQADLLAMEDHGHRGKAFTIWLSDDGVAKVTAPTRAWPARGKKKAAPR